MATEPSISSVTCLNCMEFPLELWPALLVRGLSGLMISGPIFDFLGGLVHGRDRNICPPSDARPDARQTKWKRPMETPASIFDLSGRVAIVTGGNGGIGLGIAQALATAGCNVSIWGRNADKNASAAATMANSDGKVDTQVCDVTDTASVKAAMDATLQKFGRVDGC